MCSLSMRQRCFRHCCGFCHSYQPFLDTAFS
jgi:hypothetical protein